MCARMKQYLSDTEYLEKNILHMPMNLTRDAADIVPVGNLATSIVLGWMQVYSRVGMIANRFLGIGISFLCLSVQNFEIFDAIAWSASSGDVVLLLSDRVANPDRTRRDSDQAADPEKLLKFAQKMRSLLSIFVGFISQHVKIVTVHCFRFVRWTTCDMKSLVIIATVVATRFSSMSSDALVNLAMLGYAGLLTLCRWLPMAHDRCCGQPPPRGGGWVRPSRFFTIGEAWEWCRFPCKIRRLAVTQAAIIAMVYCQFNMNLEI